VLKLFFASFLLGFSFSSFRCSLKKIMNVVNHTIQYTMMNIQTYLRERLRLLV
jgi:hypothetical protein